MSLHQQEWHTTLLPTMLQITMCFPITSLNSFWVFGDVGYATHSRREVPHRSPPIASVQLGSFLGYPAAQHLLTVQYIALHRTKCSLFNSMSDSTGKVSGALVTKPFLMWQKKSARFANHEKTRLSSIGRAASRDKPSSIVRCLGEWTTLPGTEAF